MQPKKTRYQLHCETWKDGCGSEYCAGAMKKTFYRGAIPCDILCVGEAPGKSENVIGQPFIGPAGKLLDHILKRAVPEHRPHKKQPCTSPQGEGLTECAVCGTYEAGLDGPCLPYKIGFTNLVICIPRLEGEEKVEPDADQITLCKPRLEEIIEIAKPRLIVAVGSHSRDALTQGYLHSTRIPKGCQVVHIKHPAWILRQSSAFQGLEVQEAACLIREALDAVENPPKKLDIPDGLRKGQVKPNKGIDFGNPPTYMGRPVVFKDDKGEEERERKLTDPKRIAGLRKGKLPPPSPPVSDTMGTPDFATDYDDEIPF